MVPEGFHQFRVLQVRFLKVEVLSLPLLPVGNPGDVDVHVVQGGSAQPLLDPRQNRAELPVRVVPAAPGVPVGEVNTGRDPVHLGRQTQYLLEVSELEGLAHDLRPNLNAVFLGTKLLQHRRQVSLHCLVDLLRRITHVEGGVEGDAARPTHRTDTGRLQQPDLAGRHLHRLAGIEVDVVRGVHGEPDPSLGGSFGHYVSGCLTHLHPLHELYLHAAQPQLGDPLDSANGGP